MLETGEAVVKFRKVVRLLGSSLGHARARVVKRTQPSSTSSLLVEKPVLGTASSSMSLEHWPKNFMERLVVDSRSILESHHTQGSQKKFQSSEMDLSCKNILQLAPQTTVTSHDQFIQQQQQHKFQLQQQMKYHADMMLRRSSSGINLKFDNSSCTPTMSSGRSFVSSLSMDGSMASLDGSSFHLISVSQGSNHQSMHQTSRRRCFSRGEEGSEKCGSSGRCHCSKRRFSYPFKCSYFIIFDMF